MNISELLTILKSHNIHMTSKEIADLWGMDVASFSRKKREGTQIKHKNIKQLEDELNISFSTEVKTKSYKILEIPRQVVIENWGKRLCNILSENEITPYRFAKLSGIPEYKINKYILDSKEPTVSDLNKIKSYFDVSIDWLLYGEIKSTQPQNIQLSASEISKLKKLLNDI